MCQPWHTEKNQHIQRVCPFSAHFFVAPLRVENKQHTSPNCCSQVQHSRHGTALGIHSTPSGHLIVYNWKPPWSIAKSSTSRPCPIFFHSNVWLPGSPHSNLSGMDVIKAVPRECAHDCWVSSRVIRDLKLRLLSQLLKNQRESEKKKLRDRDRQIGFY